MKKRHSTIKPGKVRMVSIRVPVSQRLKDAITTRIKTRRISYSQFGREAVEMALALPEPRTRKKAPVTPRSRASR